MITQEDHRLRLCLPRWKCWLNRSHIERVWGTAAEAEIDQAKDMPEVGRRARNSLKMDHGAPGMARSGHNNMQSMLYFSYVSSLCLILALKSMWCFAMQWNVKYNSHVQHFFSPPPPAPRPPLWPFSNSFLIKKIRGNSTYTILRGTPLFAHHLRKIQPDRSTTVTSACLLWDCSLSFRPLTLVVSLVRVVDLYFALFCNLPYSNLKNSLKEAQNEKTNTNFNLYRIMTDLRPKISCLWFIRSTNLNRNMTLHTFFNKTKWHSIRRRNCHAKNSTCEGGVTVRKGFLNYAVCFNK